MKKLRWIYVIPLFFLAIIGLALITYQSTKNKGLCKPATTPWRVEDFTEPMEYYGGYFPNVTITQVCTFSGHVTKNQMFKQTIGQGLVLYLDSFPDGWSIGMTNEQDKNYEMDFTSPVTLPRHGWTQREIMGQYFAENNAAEEIIGSIEKPVTVREFNFIFDNKDYKTIEENWTCWSYRTNCPTDWGNTSNTPRSRGISTITKIKLGNLSSKDKAWIESMDFEVKIYLSAK